MPQSGEHPPLHAVPTPATRAEDDAWYVAQEDRIDTLEETFRRLAKITKHLCTLVDDGTTQLAELKAEHVKHRQLMANTSR